MTPHPRRVLATMTSKNQVTIPREIRERLGLKQGHQLAFDVEDGKITLKNTGNDPNPIDAFIGILPPLPKDAKTFWREMRDGECPEDDDEVIE